MKHKFFLSLFIAPFLVSTYPVFPQVQARPSFQLAQSIWKQFSSQEGDFKVLMPGTPTEENKNVNTSAGAITVNQFSVLREDEALYVVAYSDLPEKFSLNSSTTNQLLTQVAAGFAEGTNGRLISQKNISFGKFIGREVRLQLEGGVIATGRIYLANKRIYQVAVVTSKEKYLTKSIEGFFKSFQILNDGTSSKKPSIEQLNADLKQAVCVQNWSQAIKVVNQLMAVAPSPESRTQLEAYREQLRGIANSGSKIPPDLLTGCGAGN